MQNHPLAAGPNEELPGLDLFRGRVVAGRYSLISQVAVGGMGAVWSGRDVQLGREVAIKFMDAAAAADPTLRGRFDRETRAVAQLRSPYIVEVYDHGVEDGIPFLVMELLHGQMLSTLLRRSRTIGLSAAGRIASQVAKALKCAHDAGIVHRDLKPQNIFLAKIGDEIIVKVLDFGIAKREGSNLDDATKAGEILGSPYYMSPEQARGLRSVDHRSDLWSFGVILYRALTGHRLFEGEAMGDVLVRVCTEKPPPPSSHVPELGAATDLFFAKALARNPEERFQSAAEMVDAFLQIKSTGVNLSLTQVLGTVTAPIGAGTLDETPISLDGFQLPGETSGTGEALRVGEISSPGAVSQRSHTVGALVATGSTSMAGRRRRSRASALLGVSLAVVAGIGVGATLYLFQPNPGGARHAPDAQVTGVEPDSAAALPPRADTGGATPAAASGAAGSAAAGSAAVASGEAAAGGAPSAPSASASVDEPEGAATTDPPRAAASPVPPAVRPAPPKPKPKPTSGEPANNEEKWGY